MHAEGRRFDPDWFHQNARMAQWNSSRLVSDHYPRSNRGAGTILDTYNAVSSLKINKYFIVAVGNSYFGFLANLVNAFNL